MKAVLVIFYLVFGLSLIAQKQYIKLEVSETEPMNGQNITISVTTSVQGEVEIKFPDEFQKGYSQMNGMRQEYVNGVSKTIYYKTLNGYFVENGDFVIGPASIKSKTKSFKSKKVKVSVKKSSKSAPQQKNNYRNIKTIKTLFGETQVSKQTIYEGEALYLNSKVYSKYPFENLSGYVPYKVHGKFEEVEYNDKKPLALVEETFNGEVFYTLELDNKVVFPVKAGTYIIEPFHMNILGNRMYKVSSEKAEITVLKLPAAKRPRSFKGLVGEFEFKVELSQEEAEENEVITLQVSVDGLGNLQHVVSPKLNLPNEVELYADPVETKKVVLSPEGYMGKVTFTYPLKILSKTKVQIPPVDLSYFNPVSKKYIAFNSKPILINKEFNDSEKIRVDPKMISNHLESKKQLIVPASKRDISSHWYRNIGNTLWLVLILGITGVLFVIGYVLNRNRRKNEHKKEILPTKQEINQLLKNIENTSPADADAVITKMEDCLMQVCSYLLCTNSSALPRNDMYALLMNKINTDEFRHIEEFFHTMDSYRYGKDSLQISPNELKIQFNIKMTRLLSK